MAGGNDVGGGGGAQGISSPVRMFPDFIRDASGEDDFFDGNKQSFAWARLPEHVSAVNADGAAEVVLFPLRAASLCADETKRCLPEIEQIIADAGRQMSDNDDVRLTLRPMPEEDDLPIVTLENEAYETSKRAEIEDYCRKLMKKFANFYRAVTDKAVSFGFNIDTNDGEPATFPNNLGSVFLMAREWARRVTCAAIWTSLMARSSGKDDENVIQSFIDAIKELIEYFRNQRASKQALCQSLEPMIANSTEAYNIWKELKSLYEEEQAIWKEQDKAEEHFGGSRKQLMLHKTRLLETSIEQMKMEQKKLRDMLREMEKRSRELQQKNGVPEQRQVDHQFDVVDCYEQFMTNLWQVLDRISDRIEMAKDCIVTANWELFLMQKKLNVMQLRKLTLLNQLQKQEDSAEWLAQRMLVYSKEDEERQKADLIQAIEHYLESRERSSRGLPSGYLNKNPKIKKEFETIEEKIRTIRHDIRAIESGQRQDADQYARKIGECDDEIEKLKKKRDLLINDVETKRTELDAAKKHGLNLEQEAHGKPMQTAEDVAEIVAGMDATELRRQCDRLQQENMNLENEEKNLKDELRKQKCSFKKMSDEYVELMQKDGQLSGEEAAVKAEAMDLTLSALRQEEERETIDALIAQGPGGAGDQLMLHEYVQLKERIKLVQRLIARANKKIEYHERFAKKLDDHLAKASRKYEQLEAANQAVLKNIAKVLAQDAGGSPQKKA